MDTDVDFWSFTCPMKEKIEIVGEHKKKKLNFNKQKFTNDLTEM